MCQHWKWIQMPSTPIAPHPRPPVRSHSLCHYLTSPLPRKWIVLYTIADQTPLNRDFQQERTFSGPKFTPQGHAFILQSEYTWLLLLSTWRGSTIEERSPWPWLWGIVCIGITRIGRPTLTRSSNIAWDEDKKRNTSWIPPFTTQLLPGCRCRWQCPSNP